MTKQIEEDEDQAEDAEIDPYDQLVTLEQEIVENMGRLKHMAKSASHNEGAKILQEMAGTVLPLFRDFVKLARDEFFWNLEQRVEALEAGEPDDGSHLDDEDAATYRNGLEGVKAYITATQPNVPADSESQETFNALLRTVDEMLALTTSLSGPGDDEDDDEEEGDDEEEAGEEEDDEDEAAEEA